MIWKRVDRRVLNLELSPYSKLLTAPPNANSSILRLHRMCRWVRGKYGEIPATEDRYCDPSAGFKSLIAISLLTDVSCFTIENLLNAEMWYLNTPLLKTFDLYEKPLEKHCLKFLVCCPFVCTLQLTIMKYVCPVDIRNSLVLTEYGFLHWVRPSARLSHGSRHVGRNSGCTDVTGGPPETNLSPQSRSESWLMKSPSDCSSIHGGIAWREGGKWKVWLSSWGEGRQGPNFQLLPSEFHHGRGS